MHAGAKGGFFFFKIEHYIIYLCAKLYIKVISSDPPHLNFAIFIKVEYEVHYLSTSWHVT